MEDHDWLLVFGVFMLGIFFGVILGTTNPLWFTGDIKELGFSICDQEYGMDFESYDNKELRCKPRGDSYDGIRIFIEGESIIQRSQRLFIEGRNRLAEME